MAAAVAVTPASGSIIAVTSAVRVNVTGADPTVPSYIDARLTGRRPLKSHVFQVSSDGKHEWDTLIFPVAGAWTVALRKVSDDSTIATASVTVA